MTAGLYNFTIEVGTDFSRTLTWTDSNNNPINLSGYTAACQVRDRAGNLLIDFNVSGSITINGSAGQVTLALPNEFTSGLDFDTAYYDLKLTSTGSLKDRLVQGTVTLSPQITE
jgi:hypothetical protein